MNELAANLFIETGFDGVNVGLIRTAKGLVAIDLPTRPEDAQRWAQRIRQIDRAPLRYLILTDAHIDRATVGQWLNAPVIAHALTAAQLIAYHKRTPPALLERLNMAALPAEIAPARCEISFTRRLTLLMGGVEIILEHLPGPTPGNLIVRLPQSGALFAGDLVMRETADQPPFPAEVNVTEWQASLSRLIDSLDPADKLIVGRGDVGDRSTAVAFSRALEKYKLVGKEA